MKQHRKILHGEATLEELFDRKTAVSIAGNTTSMNLGGAINRRVKEMQ
jgi:hypothetical protein